MQRIAAESFTHFLLRGELLSFFSYALIDDLIVLPDNALQEVVLIHKHLAFLILTLSIYDCRSTTGASPVLNQPRYSAPGWNIHEAIQVLNRGNVYASQA